MALTLFEDFVYWTDGKSKSLRRAHKTTGAQGVELLNSWQAIKSIKVYHSLRQPEGITSICLLRPRWAVARSVLLYWVKGRNGWCCVPLAFVQCPNTSVRLQMEDAATCVFCHLAEGTSVPVLPISTWLLTTRRVSPTAPPVRSAALLNLSPSHFSLTLLFFSPIAPTFSHPEG